MLFFFGSPGYLWNVDLPIMNPTIAAIIMTTSEKIIRCAHKRGFEIRPALRPLLFRGEHRCFR
jgi:hypothetical protein